MIFDRMTDEAIADRLMRVAGDVRTFSVAERQELLAEAAKRLVDRHIELNKFKDKVRERAIAEADRRGWCGEFDDIIRSFGLAGRWSNFHVTVTYKAYNGHEYEKERATKACIARCDRPRQPARRELLHTASRLRRRDVVVETVRDNDIMGASGPSVAGVDR